MTLKTGVVAAKNVALPSHTHKKIVIKIENIYFKFLF